MRCCRSSSASAALAVALAALASVAPASSPREGEPRALTRIVALPVQNLTGAPAPTEELRTTLITELQRRGVEVVPLAETELFLARHRIRYSGGVDLATLRAASEELGAGSALVTALTLRAPGAVPRFGLFARLVSGTEVPRILWADEVAITGDEAPGWFDLGVVEDVAKLERTGISALVDALTTRGALSERCDAEGRFAPKSEFRAPAFEPRGRHTVAVVPFVNASDRRHAGELVSAEFVTRLASVPTLHVIEPGVVRDEMLRYRITLEGGVSLDGARVLLELLDSDFIVTGTVREYRDAAGVNGPARVQFTVQILERANNEIVWQSSSTSTGADAVFFFDLGKVATAQELTCRMVATAVAHLLAPEPPRRQRDTLRRR